MYSFELKMHQTQFVAGFQLEKNTFGDKKFIFDDLSCLFKQECNLSTIHVRQSIH